MLSKVTAFHSLTGFGNCIAQNFKHYTKKGKDRSEKGAFFLGLDHFYLRGLLEELFLTKTLLVLLFSVQLFSMLQNRR